MPATITPACFIPVEPGINVDELVAQIPNFEYVPRITCDMIDELGVESFEKLVVQHVILGGIPLVVEGYDKRLDSRLFSATWLTQNHGRKCKSWPSHESTRFRIAGLLLMNATLQTKSLVTLRASLT
jgi:hypothetical protein